MFSVGDSVCYPMHGVGIVEAIEEQMVLGESAKYYVLRFSASKVTAMVPVRNADTVGLRDVIDAQQCLKVIEHLSSEVCEESSNWNQRYRDNMDKLRGGDIFCVADVVKCLVKRDKQRGLSTGERKMLTTARNVLTAEICAASGRTIEEIDALIDG